MSDLARIEIDRDVAEAAARRAAEEGLSVTVYVSLSESIASLTKTMRAMLAARSSMIASSVAVVDASSR